MFNIEEDAFEKLDSYLESIKGHYKDQSGDEIIGDIEASIAEKFAGKIKDKNASVSLDDVEEMVKVMGTVEEFDDNESQKENINQEPKKEEEETSIPKKLYRDPDDTIIAGVCSGIAAYFGLDAVYVRILFVILIFINGIGIFAYLVLWIIMPPAKTNAQKLEMQGMPVNLKKLEETIKEKAGDLRENLKKNGGKGFKKILTFPIRVIGQIFLFLKKILSAVMPFLSVVIGLGVVISIIAAITGLTFAAGALFFNINSPYIISDIPLRELARNTSYYTAVASLYLTLLIPLIFILITGIVMIRRKNSFNLIFSFGLIGLWIASVVGFGLSAIDIGPKVSEQIANYKQIENISKEYTFDGINSFRVGTNGKVKVRKGDIFKIEARGSQVSLDKLIFDSQNGELTIDQKSDRKGICVFCLNKEVDIVITTPQLDSFIAYDRAKVDLAGFTGQDLRINAGEMAQITAQVSGGRLTTYIAGVNGTLKLVGSPDILDATLEGSGELKAYDLKTDKIKLDQNIFSDVSLGGETKKLEAKISNSANLKAFNLKAEEINIELSGSADAEIFPLDKLTAKLSGDSDLYYANEPKEINKQIHDSAKIKKVDNWETFEADNEESGVEAFRDSEGNLKIVFNNDTYSPAMSSVRGIELKPETMISGHDAIRYRWETDNGYLVSDWSKPEYMKVVQNDGNNISWTFLENEEFVKSKYPIHVYLEAMNEDDVVLKKTGLELEWIGDSTVRVKK